MKQEKTKRKKNIRFL